MIRALLAFGISFAVVARAFAAASTFDAMASGSAFFVGILLIVVGVLCRRSDESARRDTQSATASLYELRPPSRRDTPSPPRADAAMKPDSLAA